MQYEHHIPKGGYVEHTVRAVFGAYAYLAAALADCWHWLPVVGL
ncbi:hypothetical protein MA6G0125R_0848 [Mycobacteroides abscessus 6G-0125-R]|nr:hypothetical protein MA6G0125R_0848 [Mycobacteroides abscessus 6G-0125-R]EIU49176.1 hypothetical protein MA6G0125S_1822 [Mycobacteroides abscessus 6G-0125-S]EIU64755.1 hypothetical protein MA6G1108_1808 [Mycobacteroides abscessus 6G-1108]EIU96894.1 hypothetical protein MA6G0212_1873 [Mycobacteroides abscessus 6G-0212]ETZ64239.1 hypothetical protein L836_1316 [Mycobacteroides abscessus MAB_110811_2726]